MFTRILVPLDGTAESNAALPAARTMAQATGATVFLLQVLESAESQASAKEAADKLARVAGELAGNGPRVESGVRSGQAADEILQQVTEQSADLVIMRTRGRAGIQRAVMGSVGERLLSRSDVPIMMLRPGGRRLVPDDQHLLRHRRPRRRPPHRIVPMAQAASAPLRQRAAGLPGAQVQGKRPRRKGPHRRPAAGTLAAGSADVASRSVFDRVGEDRHCGRERERQGAR